MLELVSYGLTGLAATVLMAFCFAYSGEFYLPGKPLIDQTDKALWPLSRRAGDRSTGAICSGVSSKSVPGETFHD
jgi:hypothetical protein